VKLRDTVKNPFRNADMRRRFECMVESYLDGNMLNIDGGQNRGGSHRVSFWNGYNGIEDFYTNPKSVSWACYRAGQACAKGECEPK
jgi:hypothetical protein